MEFFKNKGKQAGILYLLIAITGYFTILYLPSQIFVEGNAHLTFHNILTKGSLFNMILVGDIIVFMLELILIATLYVMFKKVDYRLSFIAMLSRYGMVLIMGVNLLFLGIIKMLVFDGHYSSSFTVKQVQTLLMMFIDTHDFVVRIWQVFFTLHLVVLGYLVIKSKFVPKTIGWIMAIGSVGYLFDSLRVFLKIENTMIVLLFNILLFVAVIGEMSFTFWLLFNKKDKSVFVSN